MGENRQIKESGETPHGREGPLLESSLEKAEGGGHTTQQQRVFANLSREGNHNGRKGDNRERQKACHPAEKHVNPFECEPAKGRSSEDQGEAKDKLGPAQKMAVIEQNIDQRGMRVGQTRLVSKKKRRLIDEQVMQNLVRVEVSSDGGGNPESETSRR